MGIPSNTGLWQCSTHHMEEKLDLHCSPYHIRHSHSDYVQVESSLYVSKEMMMPPSKQTARRLVSFLLLNVLATSKVISEHVPTCDSVRSRQLGPNVVCCCYFMP